MKIFGLPSLMDGDAPPPVRMFAESINGETGITVPPEVWEATSGPLYHSPQGVMIAISIIRRIETHWRKRGEMDRGKRVFEAFRHSSTLPHFWEIAGTVAWQAFHHTEPLTTSGDCYVQRRIQEDPEAAYNAGLLLTQLSREQSTEASQNELLKNAAQIIAEAAARGDVEFFKALGDAISSPGWALPFDPARDYLVPPSGRKGATRRFARGCWLSHLYWLMPPGLLEDPRLLDANANQVKEFSRYDRLPRYTVGVIDLVREGEHGGEPTFHFCTGWDGPTVFPGDYPRESKSGEV